MSMDDAKRRSIKGFSAQEVHELMISVREGEQQEGVKDHSNKLNSIGQAAAFTQGLIKKHHSYKLGIHQLDITEEKDREIHFEMKLIYHQQAVPVKMVNEIPS